MTCTQKNFLKNFRGVTCHAIHRYAKANNKYMKDYDKNKELSYLKYWVVNNLYGWAMSQKLEWIEDIFKFTEDFIKKYNEESDEQYFLKIDVQYPEELYKLYNDLLFSYERMKMQKVEKLLTNSHDKTECVIHIRNLKQALSHRLVLKKFHKVLKFNQNAWLKLYIDRNNKLRKKAKNNFGKYFFKLIDNTVFEKTMKNVRKYRDIKLVTKERRRNYLVSELNYLTTTFSTENLLIIEMRKTQIIMNKPVYFRFINIRSE